jgi:SAM-dependent methyltransferase
MTGQTAAANAAQVEYWNADAGRRWAELQRILDDELGPLGAAAMARLAPAAGERIVDIGCGCGGASLALGAAVGAGGAVLGVDISAPQLEVARRRARDAGAAQVSFAEADAQVHAFDAAGWDGVFSRFGVMFFADPVAAFVNIRRGLKPGGRLSFVCWRPAMENAWMTLPAIAAMQHLPQPVEAPDPNAPGPFAFSDPDKVRRILGAAGFTDVDPQPHDQLIGARNMEDAVALSLSIGPLGRALRENPDKVGPVIGAIQAALAPHETAEGVLLPSGSWIVTATSPG